VEWSSSRRRTVAAGTTLRRHSDAVNLLGDEYDEEGEGVSSRGEYRPQAVQRHLAVPQEHPCLESLKSTRLHSPAPHLEAGTFIQ
jgi:hypothetical protein